MPAMLTRETEHAWLDTTTAPVHAVSLVVPYTTNLMGRCEISPRGNRATDDTSEMITPVRGA
jgi:putative SOS response-associated peptidase YedK